MCFRIIDYLPASSIGCLWRVSRDWNTKASSPKFGRFYVSISGEMSEETILEIILSRPFLQSITIDQYQITDNILKVMCQHLTLETLHIVENKEQVYRLYNFSFVLFHWLIYHKHLFSQHHLVVKGLTYGVNYNDCVTPVTVFAGPRSRIMAEFEEISRLGSLEREDY